MYRTFFLSLAVFCTLSRFVIAQTPPSSQSAQTSTSSTLDKDAPPAWQRAVDQRRKELIDHNGPGTDAALQDRLLKVRESDQAARSFFSVQVSPEKKQEMIKALPLRDAELTKELKQIVDQNGWPTIALVGIDASNAAMLVLTHTADHAWQRQLLPQLERLADSDRIDASSLALVVDKELVAAGKLQRYGTQFKFIDGEMAMFAVEDPANLDRRRAKALLPPMNFYKETLTGIYHVKTTDLIVRATPPSKQ